MSKVCPRCQGNGFFKVKESIERKVDVVVQCPLHVPFCIINLPTVVHGLRSVLWAQ